MNERSLKVAAYSRSRLGEGPTSHFEEHPDACGQPCRLLAQRDYWTTLAPAADRGCYYASPMAKRQIVHRPEQLILKITLAGSKPKSWRRVKVDSGFTLDDLH